jgi:hypothetical protein
MARRPPDLSEFTALTEAEELRRTVSDLQAKLRRSKSKVEDLVEATVEGAKGAMLAMGPVAPVPEPRQDKRRKRPEVALWHLTDWQGSKVTTTYNTDVMRERVERFCDKAEHITEVQRADHPVKDCTILFGGDLGEGLFNYPSQPFEIDASIFGQFVSTARLASDVVRRALSLYENVNVVAEWGNHGRVGGKRAAVPRSDNFDRMTYELCRAILSDPLTGKLYDRLTWQDCPDDIQRVEIGNYRALLIHGDEIGRNGFASPMTIVGHVSKWQSGSYPWQFRDCYMGHYHNHAEWPLPNGLGSVYQTGSPESDNRYARDTMAASSTPSQRLHFVDPEKGRVSAVYKVWLED